MTQEVDRRLFSEAETWEVFMNTISELEEEYDRALTNDPETAKTIEISIVRYNQALDLLSHGNNNPLVIRFLEEQAERLETRTTKPSYTESPEELKDLALGLSPAA